MDRVGGQTIAGRLLQKRADRRGLHRLEGGSLAWQQSGFPVEEKALAARR